MPFTLETFDYILPPHIVNRGHILWDGGSVSELKKLDEEEWSALVYGSEMYTVWIRCSGEVIVETECTCAYAVDGKDCKHIAAVLYAIREYELPEQKEQRLQKEAALSVILEEAVGQVDRNVLEGIIIGYAQENDDFREIVIELLKDLKQRSTSSTPRQS